MKNLQPRIDRLDELSRQLWREAESWSKQMDPLHFNERNEYVSALRAAILGLERARVALVEAKQRLQKLP